MTGDRDQGSEGLSRRAFLRGGAAAVALAAVPGAAFASGGVVPPRPSMPLAMLDHGGYLVPLHLWEEVDREIAEAFGVPARLLQSAVPSNAEEIITQMISIDMRPASERAEARREFDLLYAPGVGRPTGILQA